MSTKKGETRVTTISAKKHFCWQAFFISAMCAAFTFEMAALSARAAQDAQGGSSEPWTGAQLVQPAEFAQELAATKNNAPPTVVYVGFRTLFEGGHIPGATFHGTASAAQGLADLKKWAASLPRATNLVIYCGCCPFDRCPNIRPAFTALRDMGFTHMRLLVLPKSFAADWVEKGYPMEKGM
jgi:thiosulfate/3-mercaptopyruvate sulfurtransferase